MSTIRDVGIRAVIAASQQQPLSLADALKVLAQVGDR